MVTLCAPSLAVPSLRLLFYCKLDVKNDALINLADNLKTKGLPPRHLTPTPHPRRAVEPNKNSRREIANQRRVGRLQRRRRRQGGGEPIRSVPDG